jgi:hypothetical protein
MSFGLCFDFQYLNRPAARLLRCVDVIYASVIVTLNSAMRDVQLLAVPVSFVIFISGIFVVAQYA